MLDQLQTGVYGGVGAGGGFDADLAALWGVEGEGEGGGGGEPLGSVVACDFYNAGARRRATRRSPYDGYSEWP
jgi:hypothetical protein